jgi:hypothetical protein
MTVLSRPSSNFKLQTRALLTEGASHQATGNSLTVTESGLKPKAMLVTKRDWPTDRHPQRNVDNCY